MRRDVSKTTLVVEGERWSSLHAQRCFLKKRLRIFLYNVFSACAEMFLFQEAGLKPKKGLLCMRRDVSDLTLTGSVKISSSLHAQRCFLGPRCLSGGKGVFSACAEMFLETFTSCLLMRSLLCMRRDVSRTFMRSLVVSLSSLHAQRCFRGSAAFFALITVFSACAEMFPFPARIVFFLIGLLCMRRDVSAGKWVLSSWMRSSLHAQRCFQSTDADAKQKTVFSACAEMFLNYWKDFQLIQSLLCMRRDVSHVIYSKKRKTMSSLHAQRCFLTSIIYHGVDIVFSACAEMFPCGATERPRGSSLLCMRRDVSLTFRLIISTNQVFSACAEMFLCIFVRARSASCLLCMRRDVSFTLAGKRRGDTSSLHAQRCFCITSAFRVP